MSKHGHSSRGDNPVHVDEPQEKKAKSDEEHDVKVSSNSSEGEGISHHSKASKTKDKDSEGHFMPQFGDTLHGRYKLTKTLGKGTFGQVIQAFDSKYSEEVALKIIRKVPKYYQSGLIEVQILRDVYRCMKNTGQNPKLCLKLYSCFELDGHLILVCEQLELSLYDLIKMNKYEGLPLATVRSISEQLIAALNFLHEDVKLIHTDLKLENIMFVKTNLYEISVPHEELVSGASSIGYHTLMVPTSDQIKIIDFGGATYYRGRTRSRIINTRQYRSPEVILENGWGFPSDMWSVACIIAEMYTGNLLFGTHDDQEHFALMEMVLGSVPCSVSRGHRIFRESSSTVMVKDKECQMINRKFLSSKSRSFVESQLSLPRVIMNIYHDVDSFSSIYALIELLECLLKYDPEDRMTARQASVSKFITGSAV
jgi:serine/threonine protein kinase